MATVKVYNLKKESVGEIELPDNVFGVEANPALVHQVVNAQLAGRRRGTAKTKTKAEVRGGGKKPFRQKGTGNARQGSSRSPLMPGGGESFGPVVRSYYQSVPHKMAEGALKSVLSDKLKSDRLIILDEFKFSKPSTAVLAKAVEGVFKMKKALLVGEKDKNTELSARNLARHKFLRTEGVNVYDVANYEWLVMTKKSATALGNRLGNKRLSETKAKSKA